MATKPIRVLKSCGQIHSINGLPCPRMKANSWLSAQYEEAVKNSEIAGVSDSVFLKTPKVWLPLSV
jgi:hypothetical protein